jgi:hypothetical protein
MGRRQTIKLTVRNRLKQSFWKTHSIRKALRDYHQGETQRICRCRYKWIAHL